MNWYQEGLERARKEAYLEGERRGLLKGRRKVLLEQLRKRFGELPPEVVARVDEADVSLLDLWVERVFTAARLDDVLAPA
jgi:hypothetical protein